MTSHQRASRKSELWAWRWGVNSWLFIQLEQQIYENNECPLVILFQTKVIHKRWQFLGLEETGTSFYLIFKIFPEVRANSWLVAGGHNWLVCPFDKLASTHNTSQTIAGFMNSDSYDRRVNKCIFIYDYNVKMSICWEHRQDLVTPPQGNKNR